MKQRALLAGLLLVSSLALSQSICVHYPDTVKTVGRNYMLQVVPYASVRVCSANGNPCPTTPIYSNNSCTTAIANSTVTADQNGSYDFYAPSGKYTLQFSGGGISTFSVVDVRLSPTASEIAASIGSVTSVGLSVPGVIFVSPVVGSPVTTSGTLQLALKTQLPNLFLAGPTSGGAVTPTFRAIVLGDLPANMTALLPQDPPACASGRWVMDIANDGTLTCTIPDISQITGTVPYTRGGSGQITAPDDNLLVGNGTGWDLKLIPDCPDTLGQHTNYSAATNAWICGTTGSGGFSPHTLLSSQHTDTAAATPILGDIIAANSTPAWSDVPGNSTATKKFLTETGTGSASVLPGWNTIVAGDVPSLDASKITSGTMATARLGSGTASSTAFLRGDQSWQAISGISGTPTIIEGTCNATATASATLTMRHFGSTASTCNSTQINRGTLMPSGGTLLNLSVVSDAGVNASDGVFTVFVCTAAQQPSCTTATGSTLTCTIGTGNKCTDYTHTVAISQGDMLIVKFTTQAATTIGNVTAALEKTTP
jgi:hypothetical protein